MVQLVVVGAAAGRVEAVVANLCADDQVELRVCYMQGSELISVGFNRVLNSDLGQAKGWNPGRAYRGG